MKLYVPLFGSTQHSASHMLSLKAQKSRESNAVTVAVWHEKRMTNSIRPLLRQPQYAVLSQFLFEAL
jgi:hypothetical protein